jgi:hypothetical protein
MAAIWKLFLRMYLTAYNHLNRKFIYLKKCLYYVKTLMKLHTKDREQQKVLQFFVPKKSKFNLD